MEITLFSCACACACVCGLGQVPWRSCTQWQGNIAFGLTRNTGLTWVNFRRLVAFTCQTISRSCRGITVTPRTLSFWKSTSYLSGSVSSWKKCVPNFLEKSNLNTPFVSWLLLSLPVVKRWRRLRERWPGATHDSRSVITQFVATTPFFHLADKINLCELAL